MRKSGNIIKAREPMEEKVPKILSPEIHDVFHVFTSMLDIKSFMKLAITSKEMYKRCMEDKHIRINVNHVTMEVSSRSLEYSVYVQEHRPVVLQKLPCKVNVRAFEIQHSPQPEVYRRSVVQRIKDFGIYKIHELHISFRVMERETIIAIIKDFNVNSLNIYATIQFDLLRSILQLNLEKLAYHGQVPIDFILEIDTAIRELYFPKVHEVSKNELMDIMSKIQSGSLCRLNMDSTAVDWSNFNMLPFDQEGPLPDERPLLFSRTPVSGPSEYWFLHWNGNVTKCDSHPNTLQIYKCEQWELPYILRNEEYVLKDLAERRPRVSCSRNHFTTFSTSLTAFDPSDPGPLPDTRPLYFVDADDFFWMLDEDDNLMKCIWEDGCATWKSFDPLEGTRLDHPALQTYMFWKLLKEGEGCNKFHLNYEEAPGEVFKDFETLDFNYSGDLPKARPLIFEHPDASPGFGSVDRILFFDDDRIVECSSTHYNSVGIHLCPVSNRPPILITAKDVVEFLKDSDRVGGEVNIKYKIFRDSLQRLKTSILVLQNRLIILEITKNEFWFVLNGVPEKVAWKKGLLSISKDDPSLVFRHFAENEELQALDDEFYLKLDLYKFRRCLEQFTVVPFDYSGPLTTNSPLVFVKEKIGHGIPHLRQRILWTEHIWFLWNGTRLTNCFVNAERLWGKVVFGYSDFGDMKVPAMLKSTEFLKTLLQATYSKTSFFKWFGSAHNFLAYLKNHMKLPFDYEGPLPEKRPLLIEPFGRPFDPNDSDDENPFYFLLRKDGIIVQCEICKSYVSLSLPSRSDDDLPPSLLSML